MLPAAAASALCALCATRVYSSATLASAAPRRHAFILLPRAPYFDMLIALLRYATYRPSSSQSAFLSSASFPYFRRFALPPAASRPFFLIFQALPGVMLPLCHADAAIITLTIARAAC